MKNNNKILYNITLLDNDCGVTDIKIFKDIKKAIEFYNSANKDKILWRNENNKNISPIFFYCNEENKGVKII